MSPLSILMALKEYLKERVANLIKLEKPVDKSGDADVTVNPAVYIGFVPPKSLLPDDNNYDAPAIVVGLDVNGGEDMLSAASMNIRLSFITYGAGSRDDTGAFNPDMTGFMDLMNLMERVRQLLGASPVTKPRLCIERSEDAPFRWGMYEEQPWPYWYAWMTFSVKIPPALPVDDNL